MYYNICILRKESSKSCPHLGYSWSDIKVKAREHYWTYQFSETDTELTQSSWRRKLSGLGVGCFSTYSISTTLSCKGRKYVKGNTMYTKVIMYINAKKKVMVLDRRYTNNYKFITEIIIWHWFTYSWQIVLCQVFVQCIFQINSIDEKIKPKASLTFSIWLWHVFFLNKISEKKHDIIHPSYYLVHKNSN